MKIKNHWLDEIKKEDENMAYFKNNLTKPFALDPTVFVPRGHITRYGKKLLKGGAKYSKITVKDTKCCFTEKELFIKEKNQYLTEL